MTYDRDKVIDKINGLKGKRGTKGYMSNEKIADYLEVADKTVKNWLKKRKPDASEDESGYPDIPFPYIVKICELFGCDIDYLLDDDVTCRTRVETDIFKATGLSKEAVMILAKVNSMKVPPKTDKTISDLISNDNKVFLELISKIIESKFYDMSDDAFDMFSRSPFMSPFINSEKRQEGVFPINQMIEYTLNVRKVKKYEKEKMFHDIALFLKDNYIYNEIGKPYIDQIIADERFKTLHYSKKEIEVLKEKYKDFDISDYLFITKDKRYSRIDIQDEFSEFLRSSFIEGGADGK